MKIFAIRDESTQEQKDLAYLLYYKREKQFYIELPENADAWETPLLLDSFVKRGETTVNSYWSKIWVQQRIVPIDRQNIGEILRDNHLKEYDEYELLMLAMGRCAQDDYYLVPINEKELPEEIFDKVYTWVDGHTWYVQYLLNRLFALPEKTLSPELLDSLMMEILREEEYTYQTYFQLLTFNQIQLLKAIAKEGIVREVNAAAFIKKYDLKAVSSVNTSLRILIDKEFILRQPDGYIVYDRFMSIWLSRI